VAQSISQSTITIPLPNAAVRWLVLLLTVAAAALGTTFAVSWYVGNVMAEYAPSAEQGGLRMAQQAVAWAPRDPYPHWKLASIEEKNFSAENLTRAVREYELAVALSPNDYRYWMELGRGLGAAGDSASGQKALRRAVELAPSYSQPRWYFGNALLREGQLNEAFDQFQVAAANDDAIRQQVFGLAWWAFDKDIDKITALVCPSPLSKMQFAGYLITINAVDDAIRIWNTIGPTDRRAQHELAEQLQQTLLDKKQFRQALEIARGLATDPNKLPVPGQIWNGGFEDEHLASAMKSFGWIINSRPLVQVGVEKVGHTGDGSLRILFKAPNHRDAIQVAQTVIVEPATAYRFECYARTKELNSASTVVITIIDAADNTTLATSQPLPTGTNDWQRITFDFKTKPNNDGIILAFARAPCAENELCPIFGSVWYDDFSIQRLSATGSTGAQR
jgi:tetratricopeptide (TPR) repeat protein